MAIDLSDAYGQVENKIKASRTYLEVKQDASQLKREVQNNLDKSIAETATTVENLKEQQKRFQRQMRTQLEELLNLVQFNAGAGGATFRYIKQKFIQVTLRLGPRLYNTVLDESIKALGCSAQQSYETTQPIYIKVKSTDLFNLLKRDPREEKSAVAYEKTEPVFKTTPYSMNRELYYRLQNLNSPIDYYGASGQKLFSIKYITSIPGGGPTGDFYEIRLAKRVNSTQTVFDFLNDYYKSIRIFDTGNLFLSLIDLVCGAVSFDAKLGTGEIEENTKFELILQRILGLCFDSKREIDVSGNAKVAELDGVDDSFFEFSNIDLRTIDQRVSDVRNGVVEFEDCNNVKLPVDSESLIKQVIKLNEATKIEDEESLAESILDQLVDNEKWKLLVPNSVDIKFKVDFNFLTNLPKAIIFSILSPKVILPLLIMAKAIGQTAVDGIESILDFVKIFKKYIINLMSKVGAIFVEELFLIIKRDIKRLVAEILTDIAKEYVKKKYALIIKLITLILIVAKLIDDWRKCKSVVDEILALLSLVATRRGGGIPTFLLAASQLLDGYSSTRAFINVVEEYQKLGLPTGPTQSGRPNLGLQSIKAQMEGQEKEEIFRKHQILVPPLAITPAGLTIPTSAYGVGF